MAAWRVKYDGPCSKCGTLLRAGEPARWVRGANRMECLECPAPQEPALPHPPLDLGVAGHSARDTHARLRAQRNTELRGRLGDRLGGFINRFVDEPQSIRAWGLGARGEELLGSALSNVPGLVVLNDRRVAGTKGNIDHVAVAPAGVFVIDAKRYDGLIEVVDKGSFFRSDLRLTVGGRNRSELAENTLWQLKAVSGVLLRAGINPLPPLTAVLCFVDASFPIFGRPKSLDGVRIESDKSIAKLLLEPVVLDTGAIDRIARTLAEGLPAK